MKKLEFEFPGAREEFLGVLGQYPNDTGGFYYLDHYIVELAGEEIRFGIEGHSHMGGSWFIPQITESDGRIRFSGKIRYIGPEGERSAIKKIIDTMGTFLLTILLLPVIIIFRLCTFVGWCIRKISKGAKPKGQSAEEKLCHLMVDYLNCVRR